MNRLRIERESLTLTSPIDELVLSTYDSHHLRLVNKTAILSNDLIKRDISAKGKGRADCSSLPTLPLIRTGEVFGLVRSQHMHQ